MTARLAWLIGGAALVTAALVLAAMSPLLVLGLAP
jgi:hypothetical protein